jgi:excisionase family DNA binding protein
MNDQPPVKAARAIEREWLTLGEAASYLGVVQSTIRKWSDQGKLAAFYTPGGHRRFRRSDLDQFVDSSGPGDQSHVGPLVLIVNDDTDVREHIRLSLEAAGYSVREATHGEEAFAAVNDRAPDLVLLDVVMPGLDGWQLLRRLDERHGSISVITFNGQIAQTDDTRKVEPGATGLIGKPFEFEGLLARARALVPVQ